MTPTNPPQYSISEILTTLYKYGTVYGGNESDRDPDGCIPEAAQAINQLIYTQVLELIDNVDPTGASITAKRIRDKAKAKYIGGSDDS